MAKVPSPRTYRYVVRYAAGGATFVRTIKQACSLYDQMRAHKPKILLRTDGGDELAKRRMDPTTGRPWACEHKTPKRQG